MQYSFTACRGAVQSLKTNTFHARFEDNNSFAIRFEGNSSSLLLLLMTVLKLWVVCAGVQPYEQIWPPNSDEAGLLLWLEVQCSRLWQEAVCCGTFPLALPF